MRIGDSIRGVLKNWGENPCFVELHPSYPTLTRTAGQTLQDLNELSAILFSWGIRPRYLVPIFLENSIDFIELFLALLALQAVPVMVKLEYRRLELDEIFSNCRPQAVVAESRHIPYIQSYLQGRIVIEHSYQHFKLSQTIDAASASRDIPDDIASINYTYRGHGYPLGAMVTHSQYFHGAKLLQDGLQGQTGERMLVILPMAHIFTLVGCLIVPLLYEMTSVISCTLHPRHLFSYIERFHINTVCSIPEFFELLYRLHDRGVDLSCLSVFVSGGSPLTADSYNRIKKAFSIDLLHGYGLTEFTPISRNVRLQSRAGTVGTIGTGIECRIRAASTSVAGEIQVKTPSRIAGYLRKPDETRDAFMDGWFRTGDMGFFEGDHLVFVKELKLTRKVNGNIVDLEEIRRAILMDAEIAECMVSYDNNAVSARLAVPRRVSFQEKAVAVRARLRELIAGYKIPRQISLLQH